MCAGNRAWIEKGIARGEMFKVATRNPLDKLSNVQGRHAGQLGPFGHEMKGLDDAGYVFQDGFMVPKRFLK